ncbi:hypothetical protein BC938DRAFT_473330, partial [Jimgerdemannia flammicorona]
MIRDWLVVVLRRVSKIVETLDEITCFAFSSSDASDPDDHVGFDLPRWLRLPQLVTVIHTQQAQVPPATATQKFRLGDNSTFKEVSVFSDTMHEIDGGTVLHSFR